VRRVTIAVPAPTVATRPRYATHVAPLLPANDPVNVALTTKLRATTGRTCGGHEVAPGVWVRIDCERYGPIRRATTYATFRKAKLFRKGLLRGDDAARAPAPGEDRGEAALPESVDHRSDGLEGPIKHQGYVGACSGFSLSAAMDNAIRRLGKNLATSSAQVWAHYGKPSMDLAADSNWNKPIVAWEDWPYSGREACLLTVYEPDLYPCGDYYGVKQGTGRSDAALLKKISEADGRGQFRVVAVDQLRDHPVNIPDLMATIASGVDIWIALELDIDFWRDSALGPDKSIHDCERCRETHAVTLAGYRMTPKGRQFLLHNSWGTSWGDGGYAWVSEHAVKSQSWWPAKITMAPIGGEDVQLTDDDCAEDELIDSVTGKCAKICPDDSRRAKGRCGG
jgi:hypothetical protein